MKRERECRRRESGVKYKGVSIAGRWFRVMIQRRAEGKKQTLFSAYFGSAIEAARAYDVEARKIFGRRARLNFPREGELKA